MPYLFKEEPDHYSYDAFEKDGRTTWSGVRNPVAQRHLRSIRKGDKVFYYHTGKVKAIVGVARATSDAYPDPDDKSGRFYVVDLAPVERLAHPVTLKAVKADARFKDMALVKYGRLSVQPVTPEHWKAICKMGGVK